MERSAETLIDRSPKRPRRRRLLRSKKLSVVFLTALCVLLVGCSEYVVFSRPVTDLDFTFEYPREWRITGVEKYSDLVTFSILAPWTVSETESPLTLSFSTWLGLSTKADQYARDQLANELSFYETQPAYELKRNESGQLDGAGGYVVEYTYNHPSGDVPRLAGTFVSARVLDVMIPRNGNVFEIHVGASQNEWTAHEKEIQHILDTFRWKK
jgi:hypothetical protein